MAKKLVLVLGLLSLTVGIIMSQPAADVNAVSQNLQEIHKNTKDYSNAVCMSCHAKLINVGAGTAGNLPGAHKRHTMSVFLNFASNYTVGSPAGDVSYGCGKCHQSSVVGQREAIVEKSSDGRLTKIILGSGFGADLEGDISYNRPDPNNVARRQVNAEFCRQCHGQYRKSKHITIEGGQSVYNDYAKDSPRICVECHSDDGIAMPPEIAHGGGYAVDDTTAPFTTTGTAPFPSSPEGTGIWWIDQRYTTAVYCVKCHGELDWYAAEETNPGSDISATCLNCHSPYGVAKYQAWLDDGNEGTVPPDIESRLLIGADVISAHPVLERDDEQERIVECTDCHMLPGESAYADGQNHHRDGIVQNGVGADALVYQGSGSMRVATNTSDYYMWQDTGVASSTVNAYGPCFNCHSEARLVGLNSGAYYEPRGPGSDGESHYWSRTKANPSDPYPIDLAGASTFMGTNFRIRPIPFLSNEINLHWEHLDMNYDTDGLGGDPKASLGFAWDWNGNGAYNPVFPLILPGDDNARPSCPTCHESHGSDQDALIKTAKNPLDVYSPVFKSEAAFGYAPSGFQFEVCYICHGAGSYSRTKYPGAPKNVTVEEGSGEVTLTWKNQISSWLTGTRKTKIMRKIGDYPAHENDGTMVADVDSLTADTTYTDTGVTSGSTYYYRLFTHYSDETNLYGTSPRARAIASP